MNETETFADQKRITFLWVRTLDWPAIFRWPRMAWELLVNPLPWWHKRHLIDLMKVGENWRVMLLDAVWRGESSEVVELLIHPPCEEINDPEFLFLMFYSAVRHVQNYDLETGAQVRREVEEALPEGFFVQRD